MKYFVYTVIGIVAVAIVAGFFVIGSPREERARRFDEERVRSLQFIQGQIGEFYRAKEKIPQNTGELNDEFRGIVIPKDPETGKDFEYEVKEALKFALCAAFNRPSRSASASEAPKPAVPHEGPFGNETWEHKEGRICFERTIDPDFLKPFSFVR